MKTKLNNIFCLIIWCLSFNLNSQTTEENLQNRYWNYRERFRQYFISIGWKPGEGIPYSDIKLKPSIWAHDYFNNNIPYDLIGQLNVGGDVTAYMGDYMAILASEFRLLEEYGKGGSDESKAVLNEIYFAIHAIQRLDKYANFFFNPTSNTDNAPDGFFVRDDAPPKIQKMFELYDYPKVEWMTSLNARGRELNNTYSDYSTLTFVTEINRNGSTIYDRILRRDEGNANGFYYDEKLEHSKNLNEESQDQLIGVLFGFKCIMKFLNDWDEADPDGPGGVLPKKNLKNWVKELTDKMMQHLSKDVNDIMLYDEESLERKWKENCQKDRCGGKDNYCNRCDEEREWKQTVFRPYNWILASRSNYVITNPHLSNSPVYRGSNGFVFGYPFEKLGEEITGKDYPGVSMTLSTGSQMMRVALPFVASGFLTPAIGLLTSPDLWSLTFLGRPLEPINPTWWRDLYNFFPKNNINCGFIAKSTGAGMFIWLPAAANVWTHGEYRNLMTNFSVGEAELFWSVLNNEDPLTGANFIELRLLNSKCSGIENEANLSPHTPYNSVGMYSKIASRADPSKYENDANGNKILYNGMDWMLTYNFYRLADIKSIKRNMANNTSNYWKSYTPENGKKLRDPVYQKSHCPCQSSYGFYSDRDVPLISTLHEYNYHITSLPFNPVISRHKGLGELNTFFPSYYQYNINVSDWLTQNFTINSTGILKPNGNLSVCNSTVTLENNGTLETGENANVSTYKIIRFTKGSKLEIKSGGQLIVNNNTKIVIENGAKLTYFPGAKIVLDGSNAILEFDQSQLELKSGAIFSVQSGTNGRGYLHFHHNWVENDPPSIICEDNTPEFNLSGTYTDKWQYYNDRLLKVTGNIGLVTDWKLKHFFISKGFIAMGKGSGIVSNAEYTSFQKCVINVISNVSQDLYNKHNGITIPGRINYFNEVEINNCNRGITYYNRGGQEILKMDNCKIINAIVAVEQLGGAFYINNCDLYGFNYGINSYGNSKSSILRASRVGIDISAGFRPTSNAIRLQGSRHLYAWGNVIKKGMYGFNLIDVTARLKCNIMNESSTNLRWLNSPIISILNGYNQFASSSNRHIAGFGDTYFEMKDGFNAFENPGSLMNGKVFDVKFSSRSPYIPMSVFDGSNNGFFGMNLKDYSYGSGMNYRFDFVYGKDAPLQLSLLQSPDISSNILETRIEACTEENEHQGITINNIGYPTQGRDITVVQMMTKPSGDVNLTPVKITDAYTIPVVNKALGIVVRDNFRRLYVDSIVILDSVFNEIGNVLRYNDTVSDLNISPNAENMYLLYDMFNEAYTASAFNIGSDSSSNSSERVTAYYFNTDSVFQKLFLLSIDTNSIWSSFKFEIIKDWAQVNRLANHRTKAIKIIDSGILLLNDSLQIESLQNWKCINVMENLLQSDSTINLDSAKNSCSCFVQMIKAEVPDSVTIIDTLISYCDWTSKRKESYATFSAGINLQSIENAGFEETMLLNDSGLYHLRAGNYILTYFDTLTYKVTRLNLSVIADTPIIVNHDTTLRYCDWSEFGISSSASFSINDSFEYIIVDDSSDRTVSINFLQASSYTIQKFDVGSCKIKSDKIFVIRDTIAKIFLDTTISDYEFENYIDQFNNVKHSIIRFNRYDLGPLVNCNKVGQYRIEVYDTSNCNATIIQLNVQGDSVLVETFDTIVYINYIPDTSYLSDGTLILPTYKFKKEYNMPFELMESVLDTNNIGSFEYYYNNDTNIALEAGSYFVTYYDTQNCVKIIKDITVEVLPYNYSFFSKTIPFSCSNEMGSVMYDSEVEGVMLDRDSNVIEPIGTNLYDLNPQLNNYVFYSIDTNYSNQINRTLITFNDKIEYPPTCENYLSGYYNESQPCCFINLSEIVCSEVTLNYGDSISIFDMDSNFMYATVIDSFNSDILGFQFCPPQWNTDFNHINDWYSIVFKKDTCQYCRIDFQCDTIMFSDLSIPLNRVNWLRKLENRQAEYNEEFNINKLYETVLIPGDNIQFNVSIFPNPTNGELNVQIINSSEPELHFILYDATGHIIQSNIELAFRGNFLSVLNLDYLADGVYILFIPELNYNCKVVKI